MATTSDVTLTKDWSVLADAGEDFTATFAVAWRYAVSASTPTVAGHLVPNNGGYGLTREVAREGKVYAKVEPPNTTAAGSVTK